MPRDKKTYFLYEYTTRVEDFKKTEKNFDYFLSDPDIEGVYET